MDQEDINAGNDGSYADSLSPLLKRPRLDSSGMSQDAGLWPYATKNKPVGIAQPLPKRESLDEPSCKSERGLQKPDDDLADLKKTGTLDSNLKSEFDRDTSGVGLKGTRTGNQKKLCVKDGESDSGSDSTSAFDYVFEAPSESSDDGRWPERQLKDDPDATRFHGGERTKLQRCKYTYNSGPALHSQGFHLGFVLLSGQLPRN